MRSSRKRPARTSAARSDALELARLEHAQELDLHGGVDLADLVEEERAAARELEAALALGDRAREGALFVAEELALEQLPRERGAVDGDERPRGARREVVDRLGDELLARPARALDEDGRLRGGGLADDIEEPLHRGRGADDVLEAVAGVEAALQVAVLALQVAGAEGSLEDEVELVEVDGLREEVLRTELHCLDRGLDRPVGGEEDADRGGVLLANLP